MKDEKLQFVGELLLFLDKYWEHNKKDIDTGENLIIDFSRWVINSSDKTEINCEHDGDDMTDILIGMHMINLANLIKKEQNRFVTETPFSSFMDFQFLFVLYEHGNMTKSQLISANNMEMSSGIEVVNRLRKFGWITEKENPDDRRSKLVCVSDDGNKVLEQNRNRGLDLYKSYSTGLEHSDKKGILKSLDHLANMSS